MTEKSSQKKKVYLHIGTHKTGTTTIQKKLQENHLKLDEEGFSVIAIPNKIKGLMTINDNEVIHYTNKLKEIVDAKSNGRNDIIISWEGFSGNYFNGYSNSNLIAKVLRNCFPEDTYDVRVIVYLRAQDSFIESLYTQEIHAGGECDFEDFCSRLNIYKDYNWTSLIDNYANEFGQENLIVKSYSRDRLKLSGGLIFEFANIINSEVFKNISEVKNENVGFNKGALELARHVNKNLDSVKRKSLRNLLHTISEPKEYSYFDSQNRNNIISEYSADNKSIFEKYEANSNIDLFDREVESTNSTEDEVFAITKIILALNEKIENIDNNEHENEVNFSELKNEIHKLKNEILQLKVENKRSFEKVKENSDLYKSFYLEIKRSKLIKALVFIESKLRFIKRKLF